MPKKEFELIILRKFNKIEENIGQQLNKIKQIMYGLNMDHEKRIKQMLELKSLVN